MNRPAEHERDEPIAKNRTHTHTHMHKGIFKLIGKEEDLPD